MSPKDKPSAAVIVRKVRGEFDKLAKDLNDAERSNEIERRMEQGRQAYRAGAMTADSLSSLRTILDRNGGRLPHHIGQALDRAASATNSP